ncbi:MAG: hypothetical protein EU539_08300 [Promethearchaeota archaeon]|nr:MAG: hypothetical protein EU539_08300 [Candidatus Lokiarchaeota archaeon]
MELINLLKIEPNQLIKIQLIKDQLERKKEKSVKLGLNSRNFDSVIDGGFSLNQKYLIFGANKTGKTQVCHQLSIQASINETFDKVYYFDAENTFRPERIREIAIERKINFKKISKRIIVSKIMSNNALLLKLKELQEELSINSKYLILIDSLNNFYRLEQGNKNLSFYQVKKTFIKILEQIDLLLNQFNLIIIATAQVYPNFIQDSIINEIPVGNQFINHFFSEYLYLNIKMESNYVHLINSESLPEKKVKFEITSKGIEDYKL